MAKDFSKLCVALKNGEFKSCIDIERDCILGPGIQKITIFRRDDEKWIEVHTFEKKVCKEMET